MLRLADGRELIDGMSSWWSAIHGYRHPHIEAAVRAQLERLPHVMFGGLTHEPAVSLCERLVALAPAGLERVFLCDSGSVSVEIAIKLALQYWHARGQPRRKRLLALRGAYHGDTFGAMAVCDPVTGMHGLFAGAFPVHWFAERPRCRFDEPCREETSASSPGCLRAHRDELAAVILEPIVQGAGGMWFYAPEYLRARARALRRARRAADRRRDRNRIRAHGADVRLRARGRGSRPAVRGQGAHRRHAEPRRDARERRDLRGDRGAASRACSCTAPPSWAIRSRARRRARASTCSRPSRGAIASRGSRRVSRRASPPRARCAAWPTCACSARSAWSSCTSPSTWRSCSPRSSTRGVWIRPFGRLVYTMPPYVIEPAQLERITRAICEVIEKTAR